MSNEVSLFDSQLPTIVDELDEDTLAVAGSGVGNKRISIKGGVFRKMSGGKEVGSIEDRHMNVIFVKMNPKPSRTYYSQAYKEGAKISPVCWSSLSDVPDPEVKNPQAKSCRECQWSVKGSGSNGKSSACRLSWRTAVVLPNDVGGDVMQLVIPGGSCWGDEDNKRWPFQPYIQRIASAKTRAVRVVTKMQFDTKSSAPKLLFSPLSYVPEDELQTAIKQGQSASAEAAIKLTVYQNDEEAGDESQVSLFTSEIPDILDVPEPVLRPSTSAPVVDAPADIPDVIKKWSKKKG
jgi:hypothetical protein